MHPNTIYCHLLWRQERWAGVSKCSISCGPTPAPNAAITSELSKDSATHESGPRRHWAESLSPPINVKIVHVFPCRFKRLFLDPPWSDLSSFSIIRSNHFCVCQVLLAVYKRGAEQTVTHRCQCGSPPFGSTCHWIWCIANPPNIYDPCNNNLLLNVLSVMSSHMCFSLFISYFVNVSGDDCVWVRPSGTFCWDFLSLSLSVRSCRHLVDREADRRSPWMMNDDWRSVWCQQNA